MHVDAVVEVPLVSVARRNVAEVDGRCHGLKGVAFRSSHLLDLDAASFHRVETPSLEDAAAVGRYRDSGTILVAEEGALKNLSGVRGMKREQAYTDFTFVSYPTKGYGCTQAGDTCADDAYLEAFRILCFDHCECFPNRQETAERQSR